MGRLYHIRPSKLVDIQDPYESFCFDEACAYIFKMITEEKREPKFGGKEKNLKKNYNSFSEFYEDVLK